MHRRGCGVLLHITSLPSPFGVGDLGPGAVRFADFLHQARQSVWQILPLTPTSPFIGNSPYSSDSAFAGNPLLISPEAMAADGWLDPAHLADHARPDPDRADFSGAQAFKERLFDLAFAHLADSLSANALFAEFCRTQSFWLDDFALFRAIKESLGGLPWWLWPPELRDRDPEALAERRRTLADRVLHTRFVQFLFDSQWRALRRVLAERDILVIGDAPIYVTQDSADVWTNQSLFKLGPDGTPLFVAGVPPDYFSETGQRWGNPVYDWDAHIRQGFAWWIKRLARNFTLFDFVRLDHFRGFAGYWEIPAEEKTAVKGRWVDAPGVELFKTLHTHFATLPILAEDLGVITPDVRELRDGFGFPGMKVLQFAFGPGVGDNVDAPHNHVPESVVYTGTHDNNTTRGWFEHDAGETGRAVLREYLGREIAAEDAAWSLIRMAYQSVSRLAVVPMQDLLGLDASGRMNMPSLADGNWSWRCRDEAFSPELAARLAHLADLTGRRGRSRQSA
ncbi:4-alpha-glucanotransferase [Fundidesulfovibrio butyratiphilus]